MFSRAFYWWGDRLRTHPYSTNMCFGAVVTGIGDCLAQRAEKSIKHIAGHPSKDSKQNQQRGTPAAAGAGVEVAVVSYRTHEYNYRRTLIYSSLAFIVTPLWLNVLKVTDKIVGVNDGGDLSKSSSSSSSTSSSKSRLSRAVISRAVRQGLLTWALGSALIPFTVSYLTTTFSIFIHQVYDAGEIKRRIQERLARNFLTHIAGSLCYWSIHWIPLFGLLPSEWRLMYGVCANVVWQMAVSYLQHRP